MESAAQHSRSAHLKAIRPQIESAAQHSRSPHLKAIRPQIESAAQHSHSAHLKAIRPPNSACRLTCQHRATRSSCPTSATHCGFVAPLERSAPPTLPHLRPRQRHGRALPQ
eukprot:138746-Chlamydomonas_euryale.AAC.1